MDGKPGPDANGALDDRRPEGLEGADRLGGETVALRGVRHAAAQKGEDPDPQAGRDHDAGDQRQQPAPARSDALQVAAWREIALWWLGSRLIVIAVAVLVTELGWPRSDWRVGFLLDRGPLSLLGAWDGRWYSLVAEHGYVLVPGHQSNAAFFPLLPIALTGLHALGVPSLIAGVVLNDVAFLVGLIALYELGRTMLPESDARRAAVFAAVFPVGVVFSMLYAEGLAFCAIALAGLFAVRKRWLLCAALAAAVGLTRPQGFLVALPIAAVAISGWAESRPARPLAGRGRHARGPGCSRRRDALPVGHPREPAGLERGRARLGPLLLARGAAPSRRAARGRPAARSLAGP